MAKVMRPAGSVVVARARVCVWYPLFDGTQNSNKEPVSSTNRLLRRIPQLFLRRPRCCVPRLLLLLVLRLLLARASCS